ncbi:MAG: 16S rRNA (guanine(527)-N(7))-methyltransferase RsmG [Elusimicrobia bacterium]|nr:16S rRNA (guanine(527)-N(7))-methyltransferase RsmG [Elusimicrobiota bacterium]
MSVPAGKELLGAWLAGLELELVEAQWERLDAFLDELRKTADRVNLTADLDEEAWWRRHLADGLAAVGPLRRRLGTAPSILDLGAGAGFVGVALKIAWPEATVSLLESSYRKFQFLNSAAARLGVKGLRVLWRRAGAPSPAESFDAVLARAVAPLPDAVRLAVPLARPGGLFVAWQTSRPAPAEPALVKACAATGARFEEALPYRLPGEERERCLAIFRREEPA